MAMFIQVLFYVLISHFQFSKQSGIQEGKYKSLQYRMKELETMFSKEMTELKSDKLRCRTDIEFLRERILILENIVNDVQSENELQKSKVHLLETKITKEAEYNKRKEAILGKAEKHLPVSLETQIPNSNDISDVLLIKNNTSADQNKNVNNLEEEFDRIPQKSRKPRGTPLVTDVPAFSAVMTSTLDQQHLASGLTLVFDKTFLNVGSSYDTRTGVFTSPTDGIYVFHHSLEVSDHSYLNSNFIKNGDIIGRTTASGNDFHGSGSNMAIAKLLRGDRVWIEITSFHTSAELIGYQSVSFAGFLQNP